MGHFWNFEFYVHRFHVYHVEKAMQHIIKNLLGRSEVASFPHFHLMMERMRLTITQQKQMLVESDKRASEGHRPSSQKYSRHMDCFTV